MSDGNELPTVGEQNPAACTSNCSCAGSGLMRALIYTPVVLAISGLAALAMFPSLADYVGPSASGSSTSSCSNSSCPIQMFLRSLSSHPKQEVSDPSLSSEGATDLTDTTISTLETFGCCPSSRACLPTSTESKASDEVASGSAAVSEEPTDALAAVLASQPQPEAQDQSPATN